jgi:N-acyl-D-amino-acid deacylase|tara:strand:- start:4151 stop:5809 length:1659 start_codon:yes stop_codon:yes gene_type:complete
MALTSHVVLGADYDVIIENGTVYDGTGAPGYKADIAVAGDRVVAIGDLAEDSASLTIDATGLAVAPGFINLLSHAHTSLIKDGRAMSDVMQGVTLEVLSELSLSPMNEETAENWDEMFAQQNIELKWSTVGDYLSYVEASGVTPNFGTFVSAGTVRMNILGSGDVDPSENELEEMRALVEQAMQDGAFGLTSALIYAPDTYAETEELVELAKVASRYGGIYSAHIRSEANHLIEAIDETLRIGREADLPVKIHHLKAAGAPNWPKMKSAIEKIEAARKEGIVVTADMYTYAAGASGLDASMPPWVQAGGVDRWVERLQNPEIRARVKSEMESNTQEWENLGYFAGPQGMVFLDFKSKSLKKYQGMTLSEVAADRGQDALDTIIDLVIEDRSRVGTAYYLMSEENVGFQIRQPWVMFGSDADAPAAEGEFMTTPVHPRTYGNVARLLGKYVRDEGVISFTEAIHRLTLLPATTLSIEKRGRLVLGHFADIVVLDEQEVRDFSTFEEPHQYSSGVVHVLVNGVPVITEGLHTGATPGRAIRGPGFGKDGSDEVE